MNIFNLQTIPMSSLTPPTSVHWRTLVDSRHIG